MDQYQIYQIKCHHQYLRFVQHGFMYKKSRHCCPLGIPLNKKCLVYRRMNQNLVGNETCSGIVLQTIFPSKYHQVSPEMVGTKANLHVQEIKGALLVGDVHSTHFAQKNKNGARFIPTFEKETSKFGRHGRHGMAKNQKIIPSHHAFIHDRIATHIGQKC